jgi:hypothetical protein
MNILEAYILQKKKLIIVISSLDVVILREISINIGKDINAHLVDLIDIMNVKDLGDINNNDIYKKMTSDKDKKIKIIICPFYPDQIFKNYKINYHININLNNDLLNKKQIDRKLISLNESISKSIRINKFLNLHKFDNNIKLEDEIFNLIMEFIKKRLDDGEYLNRIKNIVIDDKSGNESDEFRKMEDNVIDNKIDNDIMEEIDLSSIEPLTDSSITEMSLDDTNMDDELNPSKYLSDDSSFLKSERIKGSRILKKKI